MLKNYLIIAIRNLWRNKTNSFINIAGLALGIAIFLLAWLYVHNELSHDRYHTNTDRIVMVYETRYAIDYGIPGAPLTGIVDGMAGPIRDNFPEVEDLARVYRDWTATVLAGNRQFYNTPVYQVDSSFFNFI